ncbi:STAS domain-containing protein [Actinoplanes sp. NPDC026619]|uniref:STAS domain-containing protein n=1 Tax=Actinoplanes sp. NPDC026619 TaxID=3155798 RepID=UPI0033C12B91
MSFDCAIERAGDTIIVAPEGDIGVETTATMREVLRQVVESHDGDRIDVDLRAVTFLDSTGLGMLIAAHRAAAAKGIDLKLTDPGPVVRMVLEISALEETLVRKPADD